MLKKELMEARKLTLGLKTLIELQNIGFEKNKKVLYDTFNT
jgi:hypothetical protein